MSSDIEQFLKYASPRLEYLYGDMVKMAGPGAGITMRIAKNLAKTVVDATTGKVLPEAAEAASKAVRASGRVLKTVEHAGGGGMIDDAARAAAGAAEHMLPQVIEGGAQAAAKGVNAATRAAAGSGSLFKDFMLRSGQELASFITDPIGGVAKRIGRWLGASGHFNRKTGQWVFDGARKEGIGNALVNWGQRFNQRFGSGAFRSAIGKNAHDLIRSGKMTAEEFRALHKNGLRNFATKALGFGGLMGLGQIPVVGDVINAPFDYLTPTGLAFKGIEKGTEWFGNLQQKATQQGFDAATLSALATQQQMSNAIRNGGRWQHLMGLIDPDGYANTVDDRSIPVLASTFADRARQMNVQNNFEQILKMLQYQHMNNNSNLA